MHLADVSSSVSKSGNNETNFINATKKVSNDFIKSVTSNSNNFYRKSLIQSQYSLLFSMNFVRGSVT